MPKRQKTTITDPSELINEGLQETTETSQTSLAKQLAGNARAKLTEITREQQSLEQSIATKQVQCADLEDAADQAEDDYQRAARHQQHIESRIAKERVRVQVASGTPAEQESLASLAQLQKDLDSAQKAIDQATKTREASARAIEEVPAIRNDIAHHQAELAELSNLQRELEEIYEEQWLIYGKERQELARQRVEEAERELDRRKQAITDDLVDWPELCEELIESLRKPVEVREVPRVEEVEKIVSAAGEESSDPTISLMREWLNFVESVRRYAPKAKRRVRGNSLSLFNILALSEGQLQRFSTPSSWRMMRQQASDEDEWIWATPETDAIRLLMEELRNEHLGWQYQRRDF